MNAPVAAKPRDTSAALDAACSQVRSSWNPLERQRRALVAAAAQRRLISLVLLHDADRLLKCAAQPQFAG